ncbi:MAG: BamA/TamA family outer membrane protein, partial [Candidatus Cloacimonetes bacterium]|nr:BamA/TamA family outer membrane protein [Candidatus Cloacimonadota bacterium]
AELSKTMAGVFYGDISVNDEYLLISNYFDGAWDIYFDENPLSNLSFQDAAPAQEFTRDQRLLDKIDLTRLDYFGKRTKVIKHNVKSVRTQDPRRPALGLDNYSMADTLRIPRDFPWDNRPDSISVIPTPKPYRTKFALEYLWGGMAYSSSVGTVGNIELGLSDLMGNHGIGISLGVSGKLEQSNALLSYTYLKHRTDYGIGIYNFYDETIYRYVLPGQDEYERLREQESGVYFMARYPFSRYLRLEFDGRFYKAMQAWDYLYAQDVEEEDWTEDLSKSYDTVFAPGISLVHDNSLSGSTGPLLGWRAIYHIRKSFAQKENEYLTNYLDIRSYTLFNQRYSVALRLNGGISTGKNPDKFNLSGYYGVRALDEDLVGEKKLLTSMELRFPFFDYIAMAFPIPLVLGSIRGSAFADVGAVWDNTETFRGSREGVLEKVKFGYGFGPRMNLGYFVMKLDVAWLSDLSKISKPQYYLSLTSDF